MKLVYTFTIILFLSNTLAAQKVFIGSDVSINSVSTITSSINGLNFNPGIVQLSSNIELLWDSKKRVFTQHGLKIPLSMSYPKLNGQPYVAAKIGLLYSYNTGFDYSEEEGHKIGMTGYFGPHFGFSDRVEIDQPDTKVIPAIGLSAGFGISFKMFNQARARIMYNFSYDLFGLKDLVNASHNNRFASNGFSIGFSIPLSKINGKAFKDRSRNLKIKQ